MGIKITLSSFVPFVFIYKFLKIKKNEASIVKYLTSQPTRLNKSDKFSNVEQY